MSELDLDALERLNDARTPGPWRSDYERLWFDDARIGENIDAQRVGDTIQQGANNAAFIAAAANAMPELLRLARRAADAERERDSALARVTAYAKTLVKARQDLIWIRDELEDEGDRVYFGSTNHAETFSETVERFDEWVWDDTMRAAELPDVYSELASALSRLNALREKCAPFVREAALWPEYCRDSDAVFIADVDDVEPLLEEAAAEGHGRITYSKDITVGDLRELARAVKEGE